jgi:2-iminobutanoate/2-iminopropanoate deaminase
VAKTVISTAGAPKAIGPYSQAIKVALGEMLFCSGQIGLDPSSGELVPGGVEAEAQRAMQNLAAVIEAAGCSFDQVVKATIYLADMADFAKVNAIYGAYFPKDPPARATVAAAGLPKGAHVEIDMILVR